MKNKQISRINSYSRLSACISCFFSTCSLTESYLRSNPLWVLIGLSLLLAFLNISSNKNYFDSYFSSRKSLSAFKFLLKLVAVITHSLSSIYGFISLIISLPLVDHNIALVPIVFMSLIFIGTSIGIFNLRA